MSTNVNKCQRMSAYEQRSLRMTSYSAYDQRTLRMANVIIRKLYVIYVTQSPGIRQDVHIRCRYARHTLEVRYSYAINTLDVRYCTVHLHANVWQRMATYVHCMSTVLDL